MRTTQRCEGMNNYMKDYVCSGEKLFEFIPQIDRALMWLRNNFFGDEYVSKCKSSVILSHLKPLEEHASSVYNYQIYLDVAEQIMHKSKYTHIVVEEEDNCRVYHLSIYQFPDKKRKVFYHLDRVGVQEFDKDGVWDSEKHNRHLISCDCNLFEGKGIPCRHMFYVMKVEYFKKILESMIFKRWTKSAALDVLIKLQPDDEFSKGIDISWFTSLSAKCNYLCHNGSQTEEGFNLVKKELIVLQNTLQGLNDEIRNKAKKNQTDSEPRSHIIKDPNVVKTKRRLSAQLNLAHRQKNPRNIEDQISAVFATLLGMTYTTVN
ncbi:hypothetical protein LWI28_003998 [Acer negundo]|uniref:Protein FAR1-RELATED SEQUENCE n=1 Tax=Acer negundo TaxID=4023 RepID=A0AAD5IHL6_ACENE|nr:hypothetical protein LWI28_003998 [Acer negundo]